MFPSAVASRMVSGQEDFGYVLEMWNPLPNNTPEKFSYTSLRICCKALYSSILIAYLVARRRPWQSGSWKLKELRKPSP
jgi:hypothetical protein